MGGPQAGAVDRISANDAMQLATDVGPVPMNIGAVLVLRGAVDPDVVVAVLAQRITRIRRLRQRLVKPGRGLGRPIWVDDAAFDWRAHIRIVRCGAPIDRRALLDLAVASVIEPLPRERPLWRATLVTGMQGGQAALVIVVHHVLADGIGGLAVLAALADGPQSPVVTRPGATGRLRQTPAPVHAPTSQWPAAAPTSAQLVVERARAVGTSLLRIPGAASTLVGAVGELRGARGERAPVCSLNAATGPHRRIATAHADLETVLRAARAAGATVNDMLVVAVTGALGDVLAGRGEHPERLVVSVPVARRTATDMGHLGNAVGVMPVAAPLVGSAQERLAAVAARTRTQRGTSRGASTALVTPSFRLLAAVRAFQPLIERQRLVTTFLTNLRGPGAPLSLAGDPIMEVIPVTITAGNVTIAFAAMSYAGALTITVIGDPVHGPPVEGLALDLERHLSAM